MMGDIGKVLACWGQVLLRGKEWRGSSMGVNGGVMVWVLYAPEDGGAPQTVETWVPFSMKWDFPESDRDGYMNVQCLLRCADARTLSARKLMVRVGVSALGHAMVPMQAELAAAQEVPEDVQLLRRRYPVKLPREAGEKTFQMEETLSAVAAVARSVKDALVVADLPFGSYQCGDDLAMTNAVACLKAGADAVKLEGGASVCGLIRRMTEAGIPVLAHVGMMPQSVNSYGGFKMQGKTREAAARVLADAGAVEAAGAFAVTLECVPAELAAEITAALKIPTVGIGAGPVCDAQWLVMHDLLGLNEGRVPSFAKRYANLAAEVKHAFSEYVAEVASGTFPAAAK
jgi:3-methyl-2-oxobutanoate hydroxymethyltransferase